MGHVSGEKFFDYIDTEPCVSAKHLISLGLSWLRPAAVPGQGGEHPVNERPLRYWRDLFSDRGYRCFDCIRPAVLTEKLIRLCYRYNSLLYVNQGVIADLAPLIWRLRRRGVGLLPRRTVTGIAQLSARRKVAGFAEC